MKEKQEESRKWVHNLKKQKEERKQLHLKSLIKMEEKMKESEEVKTQKRKAMLEEKMFMRL